MISTTVETGQKIHLFGYPGFEVDFGGLVEKMSDDDFFQFCSRNRDARIEREENGEIIIMAPTSSETGGMNFELTALLAIWARQDGTGKGFDSSTGFTLPNTAMRSPDASWIRLERWNSLSDEDRSGFARICPDFVIELRSESDSLNKLHEKMAEYIESGASLGWLIDPFQRKVYIYTPDSEVEILDNPAQVSGEPLLKGFLLDLKEIWS